MRLFYLFASLLPWPATAAQNSKRARPPPSAVPGWNPNIDAAPGNGGSLYRNSTTITATPTTSGSTTGTGIHANSSAGTSISAGASISISTSTSTSTGTSQSLSTIRLGRTTKAPNTDPKMPAPTLAPMTSSTSNCTSLAWDEPMTYYEIWVPETVTWFGPIEEYQPPYPSIQMPEYCYEDVPGLGDNTATTEMEMTRPGRSSQPYFVPRKTVTVWTVDKNPAVIFASSAPVPGYSQSRFLIRPPPLPTYGPGEDGSDERNNESPPRLRPSNQGLPQPINMQPPFTISAGDSEVVINNSTIAHLQPSRTSIVVVDDETFTIGPTAIQGGGATITKPAPHGNNGDVLVPAPTGGVVGGLPVTISGSQAVVGGTTLVIPPGGTTTVIDGKDVTIGPGAVIIGEQSITFSAVVPRSTDEGALVVGGETVELIGPSVVVIQSTTITYGPGNPEISRVVGGETIIIGSSGIIVDGITMGGPSAGALHTTAMVVGGLTMMAAGPSAVAIDGTIFTSVGSGSARVTAVISDHTLIVGSPEIVVSSTTYTLPALTTNGVVTTIVPPQATISSKHPLETGLVTGAGTQGQSGQDAENEDDSAAMTLAGRTTGWGVFGFCIGIGVLILA